MLTEKRPDVLPYFAVPIVGAFLLALILGMLGGADPAPFEEPKADRTAKAGTRLNDAERDFQEHMENVVLTGHFTTDGQPGDAQAEKYQIIGVTKTGKDAWLVKARIAYGPGSEKLPPLPIPVKIHWADDTPVLSLTDLTIPGMGTFTSRVMFFEDRYAGTWQHGEKGGHLFGTLSKADPDVTE